MHYCNISYWVSKRSFPKKYDEVLNNLQTLRTEYTVLDTDYKSLKEQYEDPNYVQVGSFQWDNEHFNNIFIETLKISKTCSSNFIAKGIMQMNFIAEGSAREELDYFKELIVDNYDVIKLNCGAYDIDYLYLKVVDGTTGNEMFELYCNFEDEFKLNMSIGLEYYEELK